LKARSIPLRDAENPQIPVDFRKFPDSAGHSTIMNASMVDWPETAATLPRRLIRIAIRGIFTCLPLWILFLGAAHAAPGDARILEIENIVETAAAKSSNWKKAAPSQTLAVGDRIRTRQRSRATVALTGLYTARLDQFTTVEITPALVDSRKPRLDLAGGAAFIFSREPAGEIDVRLPMANAALRGTQLFVRIQPGGKAFLQVFEGRVELSNNLGRLTLAPGEAGEVAAGQAPRKTAVIAAENILQWALYYPAVIDLLDLNLDRAPANLSRSIAAYRKGNLLAAAAALPANAPDHPDLRIFHAGALLAVGRLDEAQRLMAGVPATHPGKRALQRMILATTMTEGGEPAPALPQTASEAMAESYFLQSRARLEPARLAALRATELSPDNGFAWTRLAELEFSAGRTRQALVASRKGLELTPENARAHALNGFILSANNRIADARAAFEQAVRLDGAFGNGWLGLGLTKIKQGHLEAGRADLQTAATVEPTTSIFHSYLGKAFSQEGFREKATKDLAHAALLDPNDPTPPLYSAIDKQQNNRTNEAIGDMMRSVELNDMRRVFRSGFLLDQDRAVRSANLAKIYQNAGMREVAVREATRAVESDYTNASAHLFLANSYDALRDPDRVQLRYETPWFNELLLANLLAPVGGGPLSQFVSQQEYSKLLEADGLGGSIVTDWRSTSELRTTASLFGTHGNFSYGIDAYRRDDDGDRLNSAIELQEIYAQMKWQASPNDIIYFLGKWSEQQNGDLFSTYDNQPLSPGFDFEEDQKPGLLLAGWNHRWAPGSNTLLLLGRLGAEQRLSDPDSRQLLVQRDTSAMRPDFIRTGPDGFDEFTNPAFRNAITQSPDGSLVYPPGFQDAIAPYIGSGDVGSTWSAPFDFFSRREFEIYTAEIQHILQTERNTLLLGGRWQEGTIETDTRLSLKRPSFAGGFPTPAAEQSIESDYRRTGLYIYDYWNLLPSLTVIGGVSWDSIEHPDNFRNPPVNDIQRNEEQVSGKLGFTWVAADWLTVRGLAAEGMGGLTFDESVRLEPTQLAGFNQAYRTIISESLVGSVETPTYQILGLSAEGRLPTRTWWGVSAGMIEQDVARTLGIFTGYDSGVFPDSPAYFPDGTGQRLEYLEQNLSLTLNQLIGDEFSVGSSWRLTRSELETRYPDLAPALATRNDTATLNEISVFGNWISPTGFFAHVEANWYHQDLDDDPSQVPTRAGDEFFQLNAWAGYRFNRNLCEITAGVMNIGDSDYQLSPLNPHAEIARERTFFVGCRMGF
jgi:tetratricopeptide (TPR) repeat protein